jgi:hypothetical protein
LLLAGGAITLPLIWREIRESSVAGSSDAVVAADVPATVEQYALRFDQPDSCVLVPSLSLDLGQAFAWEAWCQPEAGLPVSAAGQFVGQLGPVQLKIWQERWQAPIVDVARGGASGVFLESPREPDAGARVHVAFQWTGEEPLLFVNGTPAPEQLRDFNLYETPEDLLARLFDAQTPAWLRIGNFDYGKEGTPEESGHFGGTIDAVRVSQGLRYKEAFEPGALVADDQTVALYDFREGDGGILYDLSGHGHDGTILNATWLVREDALD